jgi:hypothetical protein
MQRFAVVKWSAPLLALFVFSGLGAAPPVTHDTSLVRNVAGAWNAAAIEFSNRAQPAERFDLVASLGASAQLELRPDGRYVMVLDLPDLGPERIEGRVDTAAATLRLQDDLTFTMALEGSRLVLTSEDTAFDFHESGHEVPARLRLVFERQR